MVSLIAASTTQSTCWQAKIVWPPMPRPRYRWKTEEDNKKKQQNVINKQHTQAICSLKLIYYTMHIYTYKTSKWKKKKNLHKYFCRCRNWGLFLSLFFSDCARAMDSARWPVGVWPDHFTMYLGECDNGTKSPQKILICKCWLLE